jgi:hypothetical protein
MLANVKKVLVFYIIFLGLESERLFNVLVLYYLVHFFQMDYGFNKIKIVHSVSKILEF